MGAEAVTRDHLIRLALVDPKTTATSQTIDAHKMILYDFMTPLQFGPQMNIWSPKQALMGGQQLKSDLG